MGKAPILTLLFGFVMVLFIYDFTLFYSTLTNFGGAIDEALDAGLIAGIIEEDSRRGEIFIDSDRGYNKARTVLEQNLKLDSNLENSIYEGSIFDFSIEQTGQGFPVAHGKFKAGVRFATPRFLGIESIPMEISKTQNYLSNYH